MVEDNQKIVDQQYKKIQENLEYKNNIGVVTQEYIKGKITVGEARKKLNKIQGEHLVKTIDKKHATDID